MSCFDKYGTQGAINLIYLARERRNLVKCKKKVKTNLKISTTMKNV